jgi:hypothetical protein
LRAVRRAVWRMRFFADAVLAMSDQVLRHVMKRKSIVAASRHAEGPGRYTPTPAASSRTATARREAALARGGGLSDA